MIRRVPCVALAAALLALGAAAPLTAQHVRPTTAPGGVGRVALPDARGNVAGEWRVWAADAWSSRYSPLEQIDAQNFNRLEVAWQWNASAFGSDEYYRTTPLYANGRLFTVATTRRIAAALDPRDGRDAVVVSP